MTFAGATPVAALAAGNGDDQAEWRQSYEASPQMAVGREFDADPVAAMVSATEAAIQKDLDIVAKGGWANCRPALR